jgi:hypothetical protein
MHRRSVLKLAVLSAMASKLSPARAGAVEDPKPPKQGKQTMTNVNETIVRYIAAWSEPDARKRRELVAKVWIEDGTYIDGAREGRGYDGITAMIGTAQEHFPGYRLNLASGIETHHTYVRFSWAAGGTAEAPLYIKGTDFASISSDGRFSSVVGFVDAAPAPTPK